MNNNPKVSVIVGCYNVAKWLKMGRLENIYNQTYTNWELILVDDGSTDDTPMLVDAEAQNDARVKVIHKENGGLGSARNAGIDNATGDYICSFDVDDNVEPDMLEYCVQQMEEKGVDLLMFGFYAISPQLHLRENIQLHETLIHSQEELQQYYLDRILFVRHGNGFFWNKCYRRSFLEKHHLRFTDQRIQQDEYFNLKVYEHLEHCYISPRILYHYYIYTSGNNRSRFIPNRMEIYKSIYKQFRFLQRKWKLEDSRFEEYLNRRIYGNLHDLLKFNLVHPNTSWTKEEQLAEINRVLSDEDYSMAFEYALKQKKSLEDYLYLKAYQFRSIKMIRILNGVFKNLRKLKQWIKPSPYNKR